MRAKQKSGLQRFGLSALGESERSTMKNLHDTVKSYLNTQSSLEQIEFQLKRIADMLEGLLVSSNPLPPDLEVPDDPSKVVFYGNEADDIIRERLAAIRRESRS